MKQKKSEYREAGWTQRRSNTNDRLLYIEDPLFKSQVLHQRKMCCWIENELLIYAECNDNNRAESWAVNADWWCNNVSSRQQLEAGL